MIYEALTTSGKKVNLGLPLYSKINQSENAPADDLTVLLPLIENIEELDEIRVFYNGDIIFEGIVDEQMIECSSKGMFLKIVARSMASLLLDSQARPQSYVTPSLPVIFKRHAKPFGFKSFIGETKYFPVEFYVTNGMSEWAAIYKFCKKFLGVTPRVLPGKILDASKEKYCNNVCFSNNKTGIEYYYISQQNKRYKLISDVYIRTQKNSGYDTVLSNQNIHDRKINRFRYIDAINDYKTPFPYAKRLVASCENKSYELNLICPGVANVKVGETVFVYDKPLGIDGSFLVSRIKYNLSLNSEHCYISLRKGEK